MEMLKERYFAKIFANEQLVDSQSGADLSQMVANMLVKLENENSSVSCEIMDQETGEIVHRFRKVARQE